MNGLRVGWLYLKVGVLNELQYRVNFFVSLFQALIQVATGLIVLSLVYSHTTELHGWSESELLALLAPVLCTTIFGPRFADSVPQLRILTIGSLGIVATKLLGNALVAQGRPLRQTLAILSSFVVILVLDVALIPSLGGVGASIASAGAYAVGGLVVVAVFARTFGLPASELVPRPSDVTALVRNARTLVRRSTAAAGEGV